MISDKGYDHDMVVEDYYKKELSLNEKIESQKNGEKVKNLFKFKANTDGVLIRLSEEMKTLEKIKFSGYRASDKSKDFSTKLNFNANNEALVRRDLLSGLWEFNLYFIKDGKEYLITKTINIQ